MQNNRCNGNKENNHHQLSASDLAINEWLDRLVARVEILLIPLIGPPPTLALAAIPKRIQPPRRRTIALWLARRILRVLRSDLNAATRSLV